MSILAAIQSQFFKTELLSNVVIRSPKPHAKPAKTSSQLTLNKAQSGSTVEVVRFCDCCEDSRRMNELGLYPGAHVEVLAAGSWGRPVMLRVGSSKFAVCQKLAKQIFIQSPAHPQSA